MALVKTRSLINLAKVTPVSSAILQRLGHWNKDWQPGQYPKTPEERAAAAKKYGLLPQDYKPISDELACGDYPDVQPYYEGHRDPYENYDFYPERRNYGESVPWHHETYREGFRDPDAQEYQYAGRTYGHMAKVLLSSFGAFTFFILLGEQYKYFQPVMKRQFAESGEAHYSFERED